MKTPQSMLRHHTSSGFTIVELMVVIVIMGIVMLVGGRGYVNQVRESELRGDAQQIVDDFDRARQKAISRDTGGDQDCDVISYSIEFVEGGSSYVITRHCDDGSMSQSWSQMKSTKIQAATPYEVHFSYPYGTPDTTQQVVVTHETFARCITLDVNAVGAVSISDVIPCP